MKIFLCFAGYLLIGVLVMLGAIFISNKQHKHWFHEVSICGRLERNYFEFMVFFFWPILVCGYLVFLLCCCLVNLTGKLLSEPSSLLRPPSDPLVDFLKDTGVPAEDAIAVVRELDKEVGGRNG